jgi:hypothetical protein
MFPKMMVIASLLGILLSSTAPTQKKSDREIAGLVGPVEMVREYIGSTCTKLDDSVLGKTKAYRTMTFAENGSALEEISLYGARTKFSQDAEGNRIRTAFLTGSSTSSGLPPPPTIYKESDRYDNLGRLAERIIHWGQSTANLAACSRVVYTYDVKGRALEELSFNCATNSSSPLARMTYSYSSSKAREALEEGSLFDGDGVLKGRWAYRDYRFDRKGNWVRRTEIAENVLSGGQTAKVTVIHCRVLRYY